MKVLRNLVLTATMLTLSSCSAFTSFSEVNALNEAQAVGNPFTQALTSEYREFSNEQLKEMFDYPDALHFARKGLAAAAGEMVMPEPVVDWNLSEQHIQELSAARGRLVIAYDWGGREAKPAVAAKAQALFDCWIEAQEEEWDSTSVPCKDDFFRTLSQLEAGLEPPVQEPVVFEQEPPAVFDVDASEPMEAEDAMYLVFFDWDKSVLTIGAQNVLDAVAQEVSQNPPQSISIVGHADTSGPTKYNERLAFRRATAVRDGLIQRGVDASMLSIDSRGETELLVETKDNVREPANRRANISFN